MTAYKKNPHTGSKFSDFLKDRMKNPAFKKGFEEVRLKLALGRTIKRIMVEKNLSIRKLAKQMGTSISQVARLVGDENVSIGTLIRFATVTGKSLKIEMH